MGSAKLKRKPLERVFVPGPGQVDLRKAKWCPTIVCIVRYKGEFLVLQRSDEVSAFQGLWSGPAGFLDDDRGLKEKVIDEVGTELNLKRSSIAIKSIRLCAIFDNDAPALGKVFIVHVIEVHVRTKKIKLDWEAKDYRWARTMSEIMSLPLAPGFEVALLAAGLR